jgi:peptidoglycan L-alanyl-D-glutamate endopeptidase CwlK
MFNLGERSRSRLAGVHPDLVRIVERAIQITPVDFTVLEGVRTLARQKQLVAAGASQTMRSRHITGHAVDLGAYVGRSVRWDWPLYGRIAGAMKQAAAELGIPLEWGGDWRTLKDGPHFQLPWASYP